MNRNDNMQAADIKQHREENKNRKPNRLIKESSPYLLQHAYNPVDWYPWSQEAFDKAVAEDKPVLVSIGYAACHWCHVMERESFENEEVASIMNTNFVNIKVDREERPDVDHIYMDAVQAMTGSGGWPLNVFLTPSKKPFYGGTYFPPTRMFNRNSWTDIILSISQAYKERKNEIELQAENLTEHIKNSSFIGNSEPADKVLTKEKILEAYNNIMKNADKEWGGFGKAPKFPQTYTIQFLLRFTHLTGNKEAREQALLSLDKMIQGGIYDHAGGGFSRYSTDTEWLVPHFEKMLYDNALLVMTLSEAYQLTGKELYKEIIEETLSFIEREMTHEEGAFFSALDADSEGVEGKFYVWDMKEVLDVVGEDGPIFCAYFGITEKGNWEGVNIFHIAKPLKIFALENNVDPEVLKRIIKKGKAKILERRNLRVRPQLDDKVLLNWNALMALAYCRAFEATGELRFKTIAEKNICFLLKEFGSGRQFHHSWKNGIASQPAFLDDYNFLMMALLELAQATGEFKYSDKALELMQLVIDHFEDAGSDFYFFTGRDQTDVLLRKTEIYDGAIPSGNAIMAYNLYRLSIIYDKREWFGRVESMLGSIGGVTVKYPTSFGMWLGLMLEVIYGTNEVAITGNQWNKYLGNLLKLYIPHKIVMASKEENERYPLLAGKASNEEVLIYLCKNYACNQPVMTIERLISLL